MLLHIIIILLVLVIMWQYHKLHGEKFYPELTSSRPRAPHLVVPDCTTDVNVQIPETDRGLTNIGPFKEGITPGVEFTEHTDDLLYREWLI